MESKQKRREFIKDYTNISEFLKKVFYYGTFSAADFEKMGMMKKSKYSYYKRILEYVFGDILHESKNMNGKKALGLCIDHFYDPHKYFLRFFAMKSYVSNKRLMMICFIFQLLSDGNCYMIKDIADAASEYCDSSYLNDVSLRRLLNDMTQKGITENTKNGYRIADHELYDVVPSDDIAPLVDLCTNIYPLSICGDHVRSKLVKDYESPFLFKHRHLGQVFNDEMVWKLVTYIHEKKVMILSYTDKQFCSLLPYRIITDEFSGRQYVFSVYVGSEGYHDLLLRIDKIKNISIDTASYVVPDDTELENRYHEALKYSFTGTTVPYGKEPDTGIIVFNKTAENEVRKRFPFADIEAFDDEHSKCTVTVNRMTELKPWLRVNMGRIKLIESSDDTVTELENELEEWRKMYELA